MIDCNIRTCVGCRMCEVACSSFRFGAVSPALSRIRVAKLEEAGLDLAVVCPSCLEKPCLECPSGSLSAGPRGEILLDGSSCDGCRICVDACPIGAVGFHGGHPLFCDLCGGSPACVAACPTGALDYREDYRDVSLDGYPATGGNPARKRAHFCGERGAQLRAAWESGSRIDS